MKSKTFNTLWWCLAILLSIVLGIIFKFVFDVYNWLSVLAFAFTFLISMVMIFSILNIIDEVMNRVRYNRLLRAEEQKNKKLRSTELAKVPTDLPFEVRNQIVNKKELEKKEKLRIAKLKTLIEDRVEYIKNYEDEITQYQELLKSITGEEGL